MTDARLQVERIGQVALLAIGSGRLGPEARAAVLAALDALEADPGIRAIVLVTPAGEDAGPLDLAVETAPALADLCDAIEGFGRPVVAALAGCAEGAIAEIALAAHFRLSPEGSCLRFPGIETGTLEGGGATQRLSRLAGAEMALRLLLTGDPISSEAARAAGLLDGIVQGDLTETALSLAQQLADGGVAPRKARDRGDGLADREAFGAAVTSARKTTQGTAQLRVIECVEAALVLPFPAGLGFERAVARELRAAPEAAALRHVVSAERDLARLFLPSPDVATIDTAAVSGGGDAGAGLVLSLLQTGVAVTVAEDGRGDRGEVLSRVGVALSADLAAGRIGPSERQTRLSRLTSGEPADGARCDLLVRFAAPDGTVPGAVRQSAHDGSGPISVIVTTPEHALGPPVPAHGSAIRLVMSERIRSGSLVELVDCGSTPPGHMQAVASLLSRLGTQPLQSGGLALSMTGLLTGQLQAAADHLLEDGASPGEIDAALEVAGYAAGPYRTLDRRGLSAAFHRRGARAVERDPRERYVNVLDKLHRAGRTGRAFGRGYYDYPEGIPEGLASDEVARLIRDARQEAGVTARTVTAEEIVERCQLALIHAGLTALDLGLAPSPAAVDLVAIHGLGYPRGLGGPMYQADRIGLAAVAQRFSDLAQHEDALFWEPPEVLREMLARGDTWLRAPAA